MSDTPEEDPLRNRPQRGCSEGQFESWVAAASERLDPVMAWLGVLFALLVGYELVAVDLSPGTSRALQIAGWVIWAAFVVEYAAKLYLAPTWHRFVRRHWFQTLALFVPALRVLRFVRLLRLGRALPAARVVTSSYRATGTARRLVRSRISYVGAITAVVGVALAEIILLFERGEESRIDGFGDALYWSFSAILALQANPEPTGAVGKVVMLFAFAFGLVIVASLAGVVGTYLVEERRERAGREGE